MTKLLLSSTIAALLLTSPARAELTLEGITINGAPALLDTADPVLLNLRTGAVRGQSVMPRPTVWAPTCQPALPASTPGTARPAYLQLDGKWYLTGSTAIAEIYPTLILLDGAPVRNCVRPGGAAPVMSQSLMVTSNGSESIWLENTALLRYTAGVGGRVLEATSSTGDLTCQNAITVDPVGIDRIMASGFENTPPPLPLLQVDRMRLTLCDGSSTGCVDFEL